MCVLLSAVAMEVCVCSVVNCDSGGALSVCVLLLAVTVEMHSVCVFCCQL